MDEPIFDSPEPLQSHGIEANTINSDYNYVIGKKPAISVFNDTEEDGDSLLFLEFSPNKPGGFAQDLYIFSENIDTLGKSVDELGPDNSNAGGNFTYSASIASTTDPTNRFAVVLIQDNERENNFKNNIGPAEKKLRRTTLTGANDTVEFLGDNIPDTIFAGAGNDIVRSGGGNDIVFGEAGNDEIDGGNGNDFLFGNQGNDKLFGGEGNDWLDGGLGNDRLEGGNGNDTYIVDSLGDQIIDSPGTGIETVKSSIDWTLQAGLDHLFLTGNAKNGTGNNLDNFIRGNNFNNTLEGGDGNDVLFGDSLVSTLFTSGSQSIKFVSYEDFRPYLDTLTGYQDLLDIYKIRDKDGMSSLILQITGGDDILRGGNGNDKLFGWGGNDTIEGGSGNDYLFGGFGDDKLFGGDGNDRLDGGKGADRLEGGFGDDIYVIDDINDIIIEKPQTGIETVESSITFDLRQYSMAVGSVIVGATGLDNLTLTATKDELGNTQADDINAFGNNLPNILLGNAGNNILDGREGNDTLIASNGDDTLIGGLGADTFRFKTVPTFGKPTIQDFKSGEDVIEISKSGFGTTSLSDFSFDSFSGNLNYKGSTLAVIQSNPFFSINQSVKLI